MLAMSNDIRVLWSSSADRLHNMRLVYVKNADTRSGIAQVNRRDLRAARGAHRQAEHAARARGSRLASWTPRPAIDCEACWSSSMPSPRSGSSASRGSSASSRKPASTRGFRPGKTSPSRSAQAQDKKINLRASLRRLRFSCDRRSDEDILPRGAYCIAPGAWCPDASRSSSRPQIERYRFHPTKVHGAGEPARRGALRTQVMHEWPNSGVARPLALPGERQRTMTPARSEHMNGFATW